MTADGQLCYETIRQARERGCDPARFVGPRIVNRCRQVEVTPNPVPAREPERECTSEPRIKIPGLAERVWKLQKARA